MNNEQDKDLNTSRTMSLISDSRENHQDILRKLGKIPYFFDLKIKQDTPKKKTTVDLKLTKFLIFLNFSTYLRIIKFNEKIQKYSEEILVIDIKGIKKETIKEKLEIIENKKKEYEKKGVKKQFMPNLKNRIKERIEKEKNVKILESQENNIINRQESISCMDKSVYTRRQSIIQDMNNYSKENSKQTYKISFEMRQIELNIPLDAEVGNTKGIVFNFNTVIKLKQKIVTENFYDKNTKALVIQNYLKKDLQVNMSINNIDFDMYNFLNNSISYNLLSGNNKILSNSRISLYVKSFLLFQKQSEIMSVDIKVEPLTMMMGFRQIRIIKDLMEIVNNSLYPKPIVEDDEYFKESSKKNKDPLILKDEKIVFNKNDYEYSENLEKNKKQTEDIADALSKKIEKIDKKIENQIKYNITLFNKLQDINFILEKVTIKMIDNTGYYEKPLTVIELSKIKLKMITNTEPNDLDNMCQALVEMLSERKPENLNICNLYMFLDVYFFLEMSSFNERVSDWEPLLEPWQANFNIQQIDKITRQKLVFKSDMLMNFNLSVQSVDVLNSILKKINQTEFNWKKEEKQENKMMIADKNLKEKIDISLIFENKSGLDLTLNFLCDENKKYILINNYQKSFTKNEQSLIYQGLIGEAAIKKKDKFSFIFNKIEYKIDEIDFSYNHFLIKKIPLNKPIKYESLNLEKNDINKKKISTNDEINLKINTQPKIKEYIKLDSEESENSLNKYVEICIKIRNNGLIKTITIESNIGIFNNTSYSTKLYFFNMKKYNLNQVFPDGCLDLSKAANMLKCEKHVGLQIPLNYIIEPHLVFLALNLNNEENSEIYKVMFTDFDYIYSIGNDYNKTKNKLENEVKKNEFLEKLTKEKSIQLKFENEKKIVILSLDILMLKSKNDIVKSLECEELNTNSNEVFYYEVILNPPVIFENSIPYDLNINYKYSSLVQNDEDKYNINDSEKYNNNVFILPLDKYKVYNFDICENFVDLIFSLNYQNNFKYISDGMNSTSIKNEKNYIKLNYSNNELDYFEMIVETVKIQPNKFFDYNYLNVEYFFSKSRIFVCYFDIILVNRLEENILIKPNGLKIDDNHILENLNCYNIINKSLNLFSTPKNNTKAKIKIQNSEWSELFEMGVHGLENGHSLSIPDTNDKNKKKNYEFASVISSSNNFSYSTILILEPRHLLVNKTGFDLTFRQVFRNNTYSKETENIFNNSEKVIKLFKLPNEKNFKNIQFFLKGEFLDNENLSDNYWSQSINIDNLQEQNIVIYIPSYYDLKTLKIDPKFIFNYDENCKYALIRVILQTLDNGLIYIILTEPKFPQFLIKNFTDEPIKINQMETNQIVKIAPNKVIPYTFKDLFLADTKKILEIHIRNKKASITLDNIDDISEITIDEILKYLKVDDERNFVNLNKLKFFISISTNNNNITRIINIHSNKKKEEGLDLAKQEIISKKIKSSVVNFKIKLKGIGLSFIDSFPKEVFYISFYNLKIILRNYISKNNLIINKFANYVIYLKNFQVDHCLEGSFKQIIYPKNQFIPFKEAEIKKDEHVDFFKLLITKTESHNIQTNSVTEKISQIELLFQEFNFKIDQQVINVLMDLTFQFLNRLDFYKDINQQDNEFEDDNENEDNDSEYIGVNINNKLQNEEILFTRKNSMKKISTGNISIKRNTSGIEKYSPEAVMSTTIPNFEDLIKKSDESGIYNIGNFTLSAIKINVTLRIDVSSLEISRIPAIVTKLLGTVGNALARITDSPLSFNELIIQNVYNNMGYIIEFIKGRYKNQVIIQLYKIIGSSDLIGNPVGLVGKIGTGFKELFNEPRKGFVNGPIHFGKGVAMGVNSLLTNVVGGGFDTVSKITGTLLNATK